MSAVNDAWRLGVALASVATSPVMPDAPRYLARLADDPPRMRPIEGALALRSALTGPLTPTTRTAAILSSLVSFTDDHRVSIVRSAFPSASVDLITTFARAADEGTTLDRHAQLAHASGLTSSAFEALLACHAATRHLARGRDTRALGVTHDLAERVRIGRPIAAFPSSLSRGGDALGDTYHYWANVIAGVTAAHGGPLERRVVTELFHAGPWLMRAVREGVFGARLFAGDHASIDHLGLEHGLALASLGGRERARCEVSLTA